MSRIAFEKLTANQCPRGRFDVTRSASSALVTHGEAYSEVAKASGDDLTTSALSNRRSRPANQRKSATVAL